MSNFQADTASSFLLIEVFQNFSPDLSTELTKFVWEVPYSVPYATGLDNGGTVVETGISKPNGCQVLGPIFLEITTPRVFKNDIRENADFHPSETLDQNQFWEVILLYKVKIFNKKSKIFINNFIS